MFCGTPCTRSIKSWLFKLKIINVTFILTISIWFNPLDLGEEILEVFYPPFRPQQKPQQIEQNIEDDISAPRSGLSGLYKKFRRKILSYRYARTGFGLPNLKDKIAETTVYLSVSKYSNDNIKSVSRIWSLILWIFLLFSLRVLDLKRPQQRTKQGLRVYNITSYDIVLIDKSLKSHSLICFYLNPCLDYVDQLLLRKALMGFKGNQPKYFPFRFIQWHS